MYQTVEKVRAHASVKCAWLGCVCGILLALLLWFLCAVGISSGWIGQGREAFYGRGILLASCVLAGAVSAGKREPGMRLRVMITGGAMLLFLILLAVATNDASVINISQLWNLLTIAAGLLLGLLITGKRRRRKRRR